MKNIYLDYAATTPIDPQVLESMKPYFSELFHNPSGMYKEAVEVSRSVEDSRKTIAHFLSARPSEVVFCDGGTEANNIALLGMLEYWKKNNPDKQPHIITSSIEHSSVYELSRFLEKEGYADITFLEVDEHGVIDSKQLKNSITENTVAVSIAYANGEVGVIQDIKEIAKLARHYKKHNDTEYPYVHTDASQASLYCNMNVLQLGVDVMTVTASKMYGPKKMAALFVKRGTKIQPLLHGGSQELSLRPGTENVPYIVGFAKAVELVKNNFDTEYPRLAELKKKFLKHISSIEPKPIINGESDHHEYLPSIVNITIPGLSSEEIVLRLDAKGIACSMKSACANNSEGDSHVILAMRTNVEKNKDETGSIRFSLGRGTTEDDLLYTAAVLKDVVESINTFKQKIT